MKTALIAGATGLVGNELINLLINDSNYEKIVVLSRRELKVADPKLEVIMYSFDDPDKTTLPCPIDVCFCTLGTTQKKSGKAGLHKVDYEYVVQLAHLSALNAGKFMVISSQGANSNSPFFYMKTKGQMEESVRLSGNKIVYIVRPSLILGKREELRVAERAGSVFYKLLTPLMIGPLKKVRPVSAKQIAKCMIKLAENDDPGFHIIESDVIQQY